MQTLCNFLLMDWATEKQAEKRRSQWPGACSKEPRARIQKPGFRSQEPGARNKRHFATLLGGENSIHSCPMQISLISDGGFDSSF